MISHKMLLEVTIESPTIETAEYDLKVWVDIKNYLKVGCNDSMFTLKVRAPDDK